MRRAVQFLSGHTVTAVCIAGLLLLAACTITPGTSSNTMGRINVLVTDSPSDEWQEVTVVIKSISLRNPTAFSWTEVWSADPDNPEEGKINLVELNGVAEFLGQATIPVGVYDALKLTIDTDPTTMTLTDDEGNTVDPANIIVVDRSGRGVLRVDLDPVIRVEEGETANVQVDFDLAHPLSIFVQGEKVILNIQLRHKAIPRHIHHLQFARQIGTVTAVDASGFTMETLRGTTLTFGVNENTIYVDADTNEEGSFEGLTVGKGIMVASNMNADGSFYARRVWYAVDVKDLPRFSPEGLVRRVGYDYIKILQKRNEAAVAHDWCWKWRSTTVYVNEETVWTFQIDVPMGTGREMLRNIWRGVRVDVVLVDPQAYRKVAKTINVQSAHNEGFIPKVTDTEITFGWWHSNARRVRPYSTVENHGFQWWYYGLPSSASSSIEDFVDTVNEARNAHLAVFGRAGLTWDVANVQWVVENLILAPERVRDPTQIINAYSAETGSMVVSTYSWEYPDQSQVMTIYLDTEEELQTIVGSLIWNASSRILTTTIPVAPGEWDTLLTPAVTAVRIWVRPVKEADGTFTWHAYTVLTFQINY